MKSVEDTCKALDRSLTPGQRTICAKYDSDCYGIDLSLKVGVALNTLDQRPIHALRLKEEGDTTGWYIWGGEYSDEADFYQPLNLIPPSPY